MSSSRKKIRSDQIPKPITIKKEKSEEDRTLHPISHYIDDRLELVKQIFGTLKPKTIMNLAPEFLKKTSLDEVEELCLNELLCISTKRLKSIIADTRCPTDTESSEDSDVEHKQEHVSLEEISSDSDIGGSEKRRAKKLRKSSAKNADKTSGNNEPSGQISVLELLELQARARAIRSQLAMEPITKIEVKSDDDDDEPTAVKQQPEKKKRNSHKSSNISKRKSSEQTAVKTVTKEPEPPQANGSNSKPTAAPTKKIKLKRNYRTSTKSPEKQIESIPTATNATKPEEIRKEQSKSRSASPDVIQIPAEPETLLISDSTDDEAQQDSKQQKETPPVEVASAPPAPPVQPAEESEPEEGEVRDEVEEPVPETQTESITEDKEKPTETESEKQEEEPVEKAAPAEEIEAKPEEPISQPTVPDTQSIADDEDQNDDVISIGGDLEMIEELSQVAEEPTVKVKSEAPEKLSMPDEEDNDVISLNTSDDDTEKLQEDSSESWRTRYLKSSKVSQVLAASRLGKRVRDKIKKSNRAQKRNESKEAANEKALQQEQDKQQQFTSKHEDGSMEQYKELLQQQRQRKSSNNSNK